MIKLKGSVKQIDWAEKIRAEYQERVSRAGEVDVIVLGKIAELQYLIEKGIAPSEVNWHRKPQDKLRMEFRNEVSFEEDEVIALAERFIQREDSAERWITVRI
jgi:hypothetical protein